MATATVLKAAQKPVKPQVGTFWMDKEGDVWEWAEGGFAIVKFHTSDEKEPDGAWTWKFREVLRMYGPLTEVSDPFPASETLPVLACVPEAAFIEWWKVASDRNGRGYVDCAAAQFMAAVQAADLAPDRTDFTDH